MTATSRGQRSSRYSEIKLTTMTRTNRKNRSQPTSRHNADSFQKCHNGVNRRPTGPPFPLPWVLNIAVGHCGLISVTVGCPVTRTQKKMLVSRVRQIPKSWNLLRITPTNRQFLLRWTVRQQHSLIQWQTIPGKQLFCSHQLDWYVCISGGLEADSWL